MWLSVVAAVSHGRVHRRLGLGPRSRLDLLHDLVAALVRHERIEASWARAYEMRGYAEQFIDCVKRGDTNERDMCMVDFWLTEKDLIHKLFKVLASQFQPHPGSYAHLLQIPNRDGLDHTEMAVIELKGNPFLPLIRPCCNTEKILLNQFLKGYREDMQQAAALQVPEGTPV
ncbi:large ribosomal subunit protein bL17m isoform X2 [Ciconia boyciana]|uniref:large ribosomal subunit protein bL17m isoform X2 n=1 Tax=Ciconia boyciana TaxID=52775 RepID=UPI003BA25E68